MSEAQSDAGGRYRIQRWDGKVWVSAGQQPWDVKQYAVDVANDLHKRMGDTYRVLDRLMRPVYVVPANPSDLLHKRMEDTLLPSNVSAELNSFDNVASDSSATKATRQHIAYLQRQEEKLNELSDVIQQHYIDTFELAWLNVPLIVAVQLLAKYAAIGWKAEEEARLSRNQKGTT